VNLEQLALNTATDNSHDPVTDRKTHRRRTDGDDLARQQARNVQGRAGRRRVETGPLEKVTAVEAAARIRTSTSPVPGSGSGCSSTTT